MKLVLASNNAKKLLELQALFAPLGIELVNQGSLGIPEAEEPFETFAENALAKARHAARLSGLPALADDSGLSVEALGGAPGVRSARYALDAGGEKSDAANNDRLLRELSDGARRREDDEQYMAIAGNAPDPGDASVATEQADLRHAQMVKAGLYKPGDVDLAKVATLQFVNKGVGQDLKVQLGVK